MIRRIIKSLWRSLIGFLAYDWGQNNKKPTPAPKTRKKKVKAPEDSFFEVMDSDENNKTVTVHTSMSTIGTDTRMRRFSEDWTMETGPIQNKDGFEYTYKYNGSNTWEDMLDPLADASIRSTKQNHA